MSLTSPSTPPSMSPKPSPATPINQIPPTSSTPSSDDSSVIDDLSFDYIFDHDGNYIRLSKGSSSKSNISSPPTPQDNLSLHHSDQPLKQPSPPQRRASLSRSESAYYPSINVPPVPTIDTHPARSFQRVASGPALSTQKSRLLPRRVTLEDSSKSRPATAPTRPLRSIDTVNQHEKENILARVGTDDSDPNQNPHLHHPLSSSKLTVPNPASISIASSRVVPIRVGYARPLLADAHQRQILPGPNRAGRIMKSTVSTVVPPSSAAVKLGFGIDKISESHATGIDVFPLEYETDSGKTFLLLL
jgi:serine/threonine-protein kinase TTK/MPS1